MDEQQSPDAAPTSQEKSSAWYAEWLPRLAVATLVVVVVFDGARWVFTSTANFLLMIFVAIFAAAALLPAVEYLAARGWRRGAATGVVMVGGAVLAVLFFAAIINVVVGQVLELVDRAPSYVDQITEWANDTLGLEVDADTIVDELSEYQDELQDVALDAANGVFGFAASTLGFVFQLFTLALFVFYILADLPRLRAAILRRFPPSQQVYIDTVTTITIEKTGGYVYSRLVLAVISSAFHLAVFLILGVPYPLALALWVGLVSQFIPTVGTYLAAVVPIAVALVEDPVDAIWVLIAVIVYQQIENYLISPRVTADTMDLHPAVAFGSVIVGAALLGGVGALLALPIAASLSALVQTYGDHHDVIKSDTVPSPEEYEAQMRAKTEEKARQKEGKSERLRRLLASDTDGRSRE